MRKMWDEGGEEKGECIIACANETSRLKEFWLLIYSIYPSVTVGSTVKTISDVVSLREFFVRFKSGFTRWKHKVHVAQAFGYRWHH